MKATLIFDNVNDLLFSKWDEQFSERMKRFHEQEKSENITDINNLSQLLSPVITSQRVMAAQFGNTYSSMQCKDKTSLVFDEWLDHVFMIISDETIEDAQRELLDCKTLVQHICGQNVNLLQSNVYQEWLSNLLECRSKGDSIPGASGVIGESGASSAALSALKSAAKDIKCSPHQHYHLMLFVGDKLLALYSSRGSEDLTPPDLILLVTQCIAAQEYWKDQEEILGDSKNCISSPHLPWLSSENSAIINLCTSTTNSPCAPHSMNIVQIAPRITFVLIVDMDMRELGVSILSSNQILSNLRKLLLQRNLEMLPSTLDVLEAALKRTIDALRKNKAYGALCTRLASRMLELRKSCFTTTPLTPETAATAMHTAIEVAIDLLKPDIPSLKLHALKDLKTNLSPYIEFLRVKAKRYFTMGSGETDSCSLTLHKYVEEFPGLIHFIYVDRTAGRYFAPDMADCADMLSPSTVKQIMSGCMSLVREGYGAGAWRRGALHAAALLWWERRAPAGLATPASPARITHPAAVRALPPPGDILGTFYRQLQELAFPNESQNVCVKELICVHLGLVPASTAVQQARRLAHTVHELAGNKVAPANDLL